MPLSEGDSSWDPQMAEVEGANAHRPRGRGVALGPPSQLGGHRPGRTCGALCLATVDGLVLGPDSASIRVLEKHAPAAGGSFPPSPCPGGRLPSQSPTDLPRDRGTPLRVGVPRGGAGEAEPPSGVALGFVRISERATCAGGAARAPALAAVVGQPHAIPRTQRLPVLPPDQPGLRGARGHAGEDGAAAERLGQKTVDTGQTRGSEAGKAVAPRGPAPGPRGACGAQDPPRPALGARAAPRARRGGRARWQRRRRVLDRHGGDEVPVPRTWTPSTPMGRPPAGRRGVRAGKGQGPGPWEAARGGAHGRRRETWPRVSGGDALRRHCWVQRERQVLRPRQDLGLPQQPRGSPCEVEAASRRVWKRSSRTPQSTLLLPEALLVLRSPDLRALPSCFITRLQIKTRTCPRSQGRSPQG